MNADLYMFSRVILDLFDLDLAFVIGFYNRIDQALSGCSKWDFIVLDGFKCLGIIGAYLSDQCESSSSLSNFFVLKCCIEGLDIILT